ncbi:MAG: hypothetical protein WB820_09995 [Rhodoplanes sp.]
MVEKIFLDLDRAQLLCQDATLARDAVRRAVRWVKAGSNAVSDITNKLIFDLIKQHYRPYDMHEEFNRAFSAYQTGNFSNPHEPDSIAAQAWDLGVEAAMRYARATAG